MIIYVGIVKWELPGELSRGDCPGRNWLFSRCDIFQSNCHTGVWSNDDLSLNFSGEIAQGQIGIFPVCDIKAVKKYGN